MVFSRSLSARLAQNYQNAGASFICNSFSILLSNNRFKKYHEALQALLFSLKSPSNVICLTETWLIDKDNSELLKCKGSIALSLKQIDSSFSKGYAFIENSGNPIVLLVIYVPLRTNKLTFTKVSIKS